MEILESYLRHYETKLRLSKNLKFKDNLIKLFTFASHTKYGPSGDSAKNGPGRLMILPVDQGFEHGPDKAFIHSASAGDAAYSWGLDDAYSPSYHIKFAIEVGCFSAIAAPLGFFLACDPGDLQKIPFVVKLNSSNLLHDGSPDQSLNSSPEDAYKLGATAVGFTIYPGSTHFNKMLERLSIVISEAGRLGLPVIVWSYPRGEGLSKDPEEEKGLRNALDVTCYAVHMAALMGADIIKVKLPSNRVKDQSLLPHYAKFGDISDLSTRVSIVAKAAFNGIRPVLFSGGDFKGYDQLFDEVAKIHIGLKRMGAFGGSIVGRNMFQRPKHDAKWVAQEMARGYRIKIK